MRHGQCCDVTRCHIPSFRATRRVSPATRRVSFFSVPGAVSMETIHLAIQDCPHTAVSLPNLSGFSLMETLMVAPCPRLPDGGLSMAGPSTYCQYVQLRLSKPLNDLVLQMKDSLEKSVFPAKITIKYNYLVCVTAYLRLSWCRQVNGGLGRCYGASLMAKGTRRQNKLIWSFKVTKGIYWTSMML